MPNPPNQTLFTAQDFYQKNKTRRHEVFPNRVPLLIDSTTVIVSTNISGPQITGTIQWFDPINLLDNTLSYPSSFHNRMHVDPSRTKLKIAEGFSLGSIPIRLNEEKPVFSSPGISDPVLFKTVQWFDPINLLSNVMLGWHTVQCSQDPDYDDIDCAQSPNWDDIECP